MKEIYIYLNNETKGYFHHYTDKNFIGDTSGKYSILISDVEYVPMRIVEVAGKDKIYMWVSRKIL